MLPNSENYDEEYEDALEEDFEEIQEPSFTYALDFENNRIIGRIDEEDAVKQAVLKMLQAERYEYEVYSWNYGLELNDLIGEDEEFIESELEYRIKEALLQDDRISDVVYFQYERISKNSVSVQFTVISSFGEVDIESEVFV